MSLNQTEIEAAKTGNSTRLSSTRAAFFSKGNTPVAVNKTNRQRSGSNYNRVNFGRNKLSCQMCLCTLRA